jgi:raffinose/stachyose/melibiose transport system substrate-binding protein
MLKKVIGLALSFSLCAGVLGACGADGSQPAAEPPSGSAPESSAAAEPVKLTFIFADGDEAFKSSMNKVVADFNAANPDIAITIQPGDGGAYSEFLKTKDSVGEFPDMMEMRDTAMYVRAGKLAPFSDELVSLFKTTTKFDGKVYAAPYAGENTQGILYNKAYFEKNNLSEPKTWDEFLALCEAIKSLGEMSPLVIGGQDLWHMGFWYHKIYCDNVLIENPDFIAQCYAGTANFSDAGMVKTFEDMVELFKYAQDGWASTPDAQITTFLVNDMSAMMFSGTHMISQIYDAAPEFALGWFPVPDRNGKINLVGGAGIGGLSLSAESAKDAGKQAAFNEFIKFFFAKENYKLFLETMSYLPTTVDAPDVEGTEVYKTILAAVNSADHLGPMWNGLSGDNELPPDFRNFTYKSVVEVIQGIRSTESALSEMQKTWDVSAASFNPVKFE